MSKVKSYFFESMGIIGWDYVEPLIVSALLANKAVMLEGGKGTGKTLISKVVSKSFLGGKNKFRYFNCPIASQDELLGFPDLKAMQEGKIEFIETPTSVWGGNSVLMDEINRAGIGMQGKFMELALSGTVMGMETGIQFRWAAVNPPDKYLTTPMDMALLSRFSVVTVPELSDIVADNPEAAFELFSARVKPYDFRKEWKSMADTKLEPEIVKLVDTLGGEIVKSFAKDTNRVDFSGRQATDLKRLFISFYKYYSYTNSDWEREYISFYMSKLVMSVIPETTNLVNGSLMTDYDTVYTLIFETIKETFKNIQALGAKTRLLKELKKDKLTPKGMETLLDSITPDAWDQIKESMPKNKSWNNLNNYMKSMALLGNTPLSDIDSILIQLGETLAQ